MGVRVPHREPSAARGSRPLHREETPMTDSPAVRAVIVLAAGEGKARGVLAALRTGVLDVLVLDLALAQAVLAADAD